MQTEKRPSSQGATWGLAILLGAVVASIQQSVGGFVVGAAIGVLLAQVLHLRTRTATLDQQLQELKQRLAAFKTTSDASAAAPQPESKARPLPQPASAPPTPKPVVRTETLLSQPLPAAQPAAPATPSAVCVTI